MTGPGLVPCLFSATGDTAAKTKELGWQQVQVTEDTLIELETLEFREKRWWPPNQPITTGRA